MSATADRDGVEGGRADPPLLRMVHSTPTSLWNDSASPVELAQAMGWGAVGATCNPVLALSALKSDLPRWSARILDVAAEDPTATESDLGWQLVRELSVDAAALLEPTFARHGGRNGRVSIQTDPRLYRSPDAVVEQAVQFSRLAPNVIVKIPVTAAGVVAIEEATYRGVSINATVSFTLAQALAVGDAVERGLSRRAAEGLEISSMGPVCTIMVGRLDDWLRSAVERDQVAIDPGYLEWAGIAVFKRAHQIYQERGYRTRLLCAAFRNHMHWSQLVGGDVVISPPFAWQLRLNSSGIDPVPRLDHPVDESLVAELYERVPDFRRAYDPDGLTIDEFLGFGATRQTLRQFLAATAELEGLVRDVMLPAGK
jgi:transaldolase